MSPALHTTLMLFSTPYTLCLVWPAPHLNPTPGTRWFLFGSFGSFYNVHHMLLEITPAPLQKNLKKQG